MLNDQRFAFNAGPVKAKRPGFANDFGVGQRLFDDQAFILSGAADSEHQVQVAVSDFFAFQFGFR
ncbi:hypothetical protein D1872_291990 [compost metagenome]